MTHLMPLGRLYSGRDNHPIQRYSVVGQQIDKRQRQRRREVLPDRSVEFQQGGGRLESKERNTKRERNRAKHINSRAACEQDVCEGIRTRHRHSPRSRDLCLCDSEVQGGARCKKHSRAELGDRHESVIQERKRRADNAGRRRKDTACEQQSFHPCGKHGPKLTKDGFRFAWGNANLQKAYPHGGTSSCRSLPEASPSSKCTASKGGRPAKTAPIMPEQDSASLPVSRKPGASVVADVPEMPSRTPSAKIHERVQRDMLSFRKRMTKSRWPSTRYPTRASRHLLHVLSCRAWNLT